MWHLQNGGKGEKMNCDVAMEAPHLTQLDRTLQNKHGRSEPVLSFWH